MDLNVHNQTPMPVYYKTLTLQSWNMEKQEKTCPTVENFEPRTRKPDPSTLCRKLRDGLQNVCSSAVALHVLPQPELSNVSEDILQSLISADEHVLCGGGRSC